MRVFTRRNPVIGPLVTRFARRRMERWLNEAAGNPTSRRGLAFGTVVAAGVATVAGAVVTRHSRAD